MHCGGLCQQALMQSVQQAITTAVQVINNTLDTAVHTILMLLL